MLLIPGSDRYWGVSKKTDEFLKYKRIYTQSFSILKVGEKESPAIYIGKIFLKNSVYGLRTYHQLLYKGSLYLIDGYEFNRGIEPL